MLVFYFFAILLIFIIIIVFLISMSQIEVKINNLYFNSINKRKNNEKILIQISLRIKKFHWIKFKINKNKLAKIYLKIKKYQDRKNIGISAIKKTFEKNIKEILKNKKLKKLIFSTKIELERFNSNISISVGDYIETSYVVSIISIIISNILPHIISKEVYKEKINKLIHYRIVPIYSNEKQYKIYLSIILQLKVLDILRIFVLLTRINNQVKKEQNIKKVKDNIKSQIPISQIIKNSDL